jgi:hypothetical protein
MFNPLDISFVFTYASIIGISTFYYIGSELWEILESGNEARYIEALKLEYDWI